MEGRGALSALGGPVDRALDAAPVVVAVARDIDLPPVPGDLPRRPANAAALAALAERHGIGSSLRRLGAALGWPADALD